MNEYREHVTAKSQAKRLAYLNVQQARPAHERLYDPNFATGAQGKNLREFRTNFETAMERRVASREREMKKDFFSGLRQTRLDRPRHARRQPKKYDEYARESFNTTSLDALSFLKQAAMPDDEQDLSGLSPVRRSNQNSTLPKIMKAARGRARRLGRTSASKRKTSHNIHGKYIVAKPKDYDQKQQVLLATLARFKRQPRGTID